MPAIISVVQGHYRIVELFQIVTSKPIVLPCDIVVPVTVFICALTFTFIDPVNERLGKQGARYVVYAAFLANLLLAGYTQFAIWLPLAPFYGDEGQAAFAGVLDSTWRIVVASLIACLVSTLIDVQVFAWWRERVRRYQWARVLISNTVSTLIDSAVFITIAFLGVMPVLPLIAGQYLLRLELLASMGSTRGTYRGLFSTCPTGYLRV